MEPSQTIPNSFFESFWGAEDDEDEIKPEVRDFYRKFLEHNDKLKAEITSYDTIEDESKKKYTVYNIKVTTDYFSYLIQKRFSSFDDLRKQLKDKYIELNLNQISFPSKTYFSFGGTSIETIEKRRALFNDLLQLLVQHCKDLCMIEFLEFLEIKSRTELAFNNQSSYPFLDKLYTTNSQEVTKLVQYLDLLNSNPHDTSKTLKEMENFFITARPKISSDVIKALLIGKQKSKGLVHFCGKIDPQTNSHLICSVGLKFLTTLMDHQSCQDADQFIASFGSLDPKWIALLNLPEHLGGKMQRQCKGAALKLTHIYLSRNPTLEPIDILKKPEYIQEYDKWKLSIRITYHTSERPEVSGKLDDMKEAGTDFSLSPQSSSMGSLDDFSANFEKLFPVGKLDWSSLYKDENIKIKYYRGKYLSISLKTPCDMQACAQELAKGIDYRVLCEESKLAKEIDTETHLRLIKVRFNIPPQKQYVVFVSERRIEENLNDRIVILERPCKDYAVMLTSSELLVKRFANIVIKPVSKAKGKYTKIKMLAKNLDEGSKALQEYLTMEESGRLIVESCQKYLEDVQKTEI